MSDQDSQEDIASMRNQNYLRVIGRLKPGVSLQHAQADVDAICARLRQQYPNTNAARSVRLAPPHEKVAGEMKADPTPLIRRSQPGVARRLRQCRQSDGGKSHGLRDAGWPIEDRR